MQPQDQNQPNVNDTSQDNQPTEMPGAQPSPGAQTLVIEEALNVAPFVPTEPAQSVNAQYGDQPSLPELPPVPIERPIESAQPVVEQQYFAPAPVVDNVAVVNPAPAMALTPLAKTPKPKMKNLKMWIIIASAVVFLFGGTASVYGFWYSNPKKVVTDGITNLFFVKTAVYEGDITVDGGTYKVSVNATANQGEVAGSFAATTSIDYSGNKYNLDGSIIYDKNGDIYFKIGQLDSIYQQFKTTFNNSTIDKLVAKIDNKWIRISNDDISSISSDYTKTKTCVSDAMNKYKEDKSAISEISTLYSNNSFINIDKELGQKDGSFGYEIKIDNKAVKTFADGFKNTKLYSSLSSCGDSTIDIGSYIDDAGSGSIDNGGTGTVSLWVDMWSHKITKVAYHGQTEGTSYSPKVTMDAILKTDFDKVVNIDSPTDYISLKDLMSDISDIFSEVLSLSSLEPVSLSDDSAITTISPDLNCSDATDGFGASYTSCN